MPPPLNFRAGRLIISGLAVVGAVAFFLWPRHGLKEPKRQTVSETPAHDLIERGGRWFLRSQTNNAFTGVMVEHFPGGVLRARVEISNGWPEGLSETWHTNGVAELREHFKHGVSDGVRERWYENGRKESEATVAEGKIDGLFERWHENGQLAEKIQMKDGHPVGVAWAYYPDGFVKAETTLEAGHPLDRKTWKDGEFKNLQ